MTIIDTKIEEVLKSLLQKDLKLYINNKQFKKGKLILFKQNNYHIEFTIKRTDNEIKRFEIPIPFETEVWDDGLVYFDYRLKTLSQSNDDLYKILLKIPKEGKNKFYDKVLEIQIEEPKEGV